MGPGLWDLVRETATATEDIAEGTLAITHAAGSTADSATRLAQLSSESRALLSRFRY
ncbi:MAG TPA: hypothetical protein VFP72_16670 [Kineosporiaceae bacterium]|nr:hypothetical protein [Kineosporiaceae bacterium]